ncbi:MAG TPA: acyl-CoA synthetase FdrA [Methylomirabilota bacterium]
MAAVTKVFPDTYRDSVELMRIAAEVERLAGVRRAALLVATPANRDVLAQAGLLAGPAVAAKPTDLIIAVAADDDAAAQAALARASSLLAAQPATAGARSEQKAPRTIAAALAELSGANLAMISTPGPYATAEALKALKRGLHVFLFSDNVPLADEIELKQLAVRKRLLVMGPDCGTAVLDGVPLGFSNAVRRGRIGLVSASGTGLQQVMCLVDRLGEGVSQAIGVGGHDLHERVGGLMMLAGLEHLLDDRETAVVVLISKPPAAAVARRVLDRAGRAAKPAVVCFLGGDPALIRSSGAYPAITLEEAASRAVALAAGRSTAGPDGGAEAEKLKALARAQARQLVRGQRAIRGLYSGGTLCAEAAVIIAQPGHTLLDLGDDQFTVGRPHPMIDFRLRNEYLQTVADDPTTAVVLLDVVLGYGSHPDPAGELVPAIEQARARAGRAGRPFIVVGSVCGTPRDFQDFTRQEARLEAAGVVLAPSNAAAARLAALIVEEARRDG